MLSVPSRTPSSIVLQAHARKLAAIVVMRPASGCRVLKLGRCWFASIDHSNLCHNCCIQRQNLSLVCSDGCMFSSLTQSDSTSLFPANPAQSAYSTTCVLRFHDLAASYTMLSDAGDTVLLQGSVCTAPVAVMACCPGPVRCANCTWPAQCTCRRSCHWALLPFFVSPFHMWLPDQLQLSSTDDAAVCMTARDVSYLRSSGMFLEIAQLTAAGCAGEGDAVAGGGGGGGATIGGDGGATAAGPRARGRRAAEGLRAAVEHACETAQHTA